jgi:hypothetical protein
MKPSLCALVVVAALALAATSYAHTPAAHKQPHNHQQADQGVKLLQRQHLRGLLRNASVEPASVADKLRLVKLRSSQKLGRMRGGRVQKLRGPSALLQKHTEQSPSSATADDTNHRQRRSAEPVAARHAFPEVESVALSILFTDNSTVLFALVIPDSDSENATHNLYISTNSGANYTTVAGIVEPINSVQIVGNTVFAVPLQPPQDNLKRKYIYTMQMDTLGVFTKKSTPYAFEDVLVHASNPLYWAGYVGSENDYTSVYWTKNGGANYALATAFAFYMEWSERAGEERVCFFFVLLLLLLSWRCDASAVYAVYSGMFVV